IVVEEKSTAENGDIMFKAVLYLRNSGRTSATIRKISFNGIEPTNIVPTVNNLSPEHDPLIPFIGKDEEFREDRYIFRINESTWGEFFFHDPKFKIYCVGYVKYTTIFKKEHRRGFCWEFYAPQEMFVLTPNSELNYDK